MYKFDDIDITSLGAMPGKVPGECLAISGVFDLPKRVGETEYNWGTSIEPFVEEADIKLDGRTITLVCVVGHDMLEDFKQHAIACRKLTTDFGVFDVIQRDAISVERHANICIVTVKLWQPEYIPMELTVIPSGGAYMLIGLFNLADDFGIYMKYKSGVRDTSKRIEVQTTSLYSSSMYREPQELSFSCFLKAGTMQEAYSKMMQFHALCVSPGIKMFTDAENKQHKIYFKDEIRCKTIADGLLSFDLKMRKLND